MISRIGQRQRAPRDFPPNVLYRARIKSSSDGKKTSGDARIELNSL
jgi:hypothetical protein